MERQDNDDIVFMASRDGLHFDRSFIEAFVRPGLDADNWHERGIYGGKRRFRLI
jgi:hypothetical protein